MAEFLQSQTAYWIILLTGLTILILIGSYAISFIRRWQADQEPVASDLLSDFRELHSQGELSDEEYRTIKAKLGSQLRGVEPKGGAQDS